MENLKTAKEIKDEIFESLGLSNVDKIDHDIVELTLDKWALSIQSDQLKQDKESSLRIANKVFQ